MTADELAAIGNPKLKMIVHLLAEGCMKAGGPYRDVYDVARKTYQDREHITECVRCGPSGKPAQSGTPWSLGHQHAAALRKVGKEILRDLWIVAALSDAAALSLGPASGTAPVPTDTAPSDRGTNRGAL